MHYFRALNQLWLRRYESPLIQDAIEWFKQKPVVFFKGDADISLTDVDGVKGLTVILHHILEGAAFFFVEDMPVYACKISNGMLGEVCCWDEIEHEITPIFKEKVDVFDVD